MFQFKNTRMVYCCKASDIKCKFLIIRESVNRDDIPYMVMAGYDSKYEASSWMCNCAAHIGWFGLKAMVVGRWNEAVFTVSIGEDVIYREFDDSFTFKGVTYRISPPRTDDSDIYADADFVIRNKIIHQ